jgi:glycosyltransferase involved in cell wall biosynthesis
MRPQGFGSTGVRPDSTALRIAMIAPPYFPIPPDGYGGIEAVVADLVNELVDRGHHITLVGAGHHSTRAQEFLTTYDHPVTDALGGVMPEVVHAARVARLLSGIDVDIVHDHTLTGPLLARGRRRPTVVTAHGPVSGDLGDYYRALTGAVGLVAISAAQQRMAPGLSWAGIVHNAIPVETYTYGADKEPFVLFLGRFSPEKAPHLAIDAARSAGFPIALAGKCSEPDERRYFGAEIRPRLGADTSLLGVADGAMKRDLLARARCLVFPICWDEPFGLVMVEAMASGTPVVALRHGSVPEIVVDGVTGHVVDEPGQIAAALGRVEHLDPAACRAHAAERFSLGVMAERYVAVYSRLLGAA